MGRKAINSTGYTVFVFLTCMWKHMASVRKCYCCGDHDGWIIILYTPRTLHCWKALFIYLRVCEDESSTSGLILYPQRNRLFSWYRLDFIQQSGPQAPPVLGCFQQLRQFKKKAFQSVFQNSTPKSTRYTCKRIWKWETIVLALEQTKAARVMLHCTVLWQLGMQNSIKNYFKQHFLSIFSAFMISY